MISSKVLSSWSQSSGCKQVGTDGELTSEIPSLHRPSHPLCGKQRRDTQLVPFAHDAFIWEASVPIGLGLVSWKMVSLWGRGVPVWLFSYLLNLRLVSSGIWVPVCFNRISEWNSGLQGNYWYSISICMEPLMIIWLFDIVYSLASSSQFLLVAFWQRVPRGCLVLGSI